MYQRLANLLPRKLCYWVLIRIGGECTIGRYGNSHPMTVTIEELLTRWASRTAFSDVPLRQAAERFVAKHDNILDSFRVDSYPEKDVVYFYDYYKHSAVRILAPTATEAEYQVAFTELLKSLESMECMTS